MIFFENETKVGLNQIKFKNSFKLCKISTFNWLLLGSVILSKLTTIAYMIA